MKKDDLDRLFKYVDEHEKSSIEFQSVWRKAHRNDWKRNLFQSASHNLAILMIIVILTPLLGHYLVASNPSSDAARSISGTAYDISGKVYNFPNQIVIKGQSNLPEGTMISVEKFEHDGGPLLSHREARTNSDGSFQSTFDRLDRNKNYIVKVTVYSHNQSKPVKKVLGDRGDQLRNADSGFLYKEEGKEFNGLRVMGLVNKIDDDGQHVLSEFLMDTQEFKASH
ncbi:hypothetical protein LCM10_12790 [Rossellomorea aquimaris]|uniref:hypothetical protein n=1 Tax=Rossellomorea aquimaris TaxID=189382 RepID=UPI001CD76FA3|nr:hypothetical protein [Rossellomorea aquimaris]MCA1055867.1 hypothetical protein [Rossellomorea aquimaris]